MSSLGALVEEASDDAHLGHDGKQKQAIGQRHDRLRLSVDGDSGNSGDELDITIAQRMISATTGSLLTSLLGKTPSLGLWHAHRLTHITYDSYSPRCSQSQTAISSNSFRTSTNSLLRLIMPAQLYFCEAPSQPWCYSML